MKLSEAIERTSNILIEGFDPDDLEDCEALQQGIEAMKAWKSSREYSTIHHVPLLPGETEE